MQPAQTLYTTSAYPGQGQPTIVRGASFDQRPIITSQPVYTPGVGSTTYTTGPVYTTSSQVYRTSYPTTWSASWVSGFSRYAPADLRSLFDRYDRDRSGYITFDELRNMYNEMGTPISDPALAYLQNTYDKNKDGRLSYPEFYEFVTGKPYGSTVTSGPVYTTQTYTTGVPVYTSSTQTYTSTGPVHYTTTGASRVVVNQGSYNPAAYSTQWNPAWVSSFSRYGATDLKSLFDRYDRDRSGFITFDELRNMYNELGTPISDSALAYLQNTYDRNKDGRLSYPEFHEFVTGQPYVY